jgi:hypothetical protein
MATSVPVDRATAHQIDELALLRSALLPDESLLFLDDDDGRTNFDAGGEVNATTECGPAPPGPGWQRLVDARAGISPVSAPPEWLSMNDGVGHAAGLALGLSAILYESSAFFCASMLSSPCDRL